MRLTFDKIEIEGFKSYTKRTVIDLSVRGNGLHFVRGRNLQQPDLGSNGAGKSTIWCALCWCLYGRTVQGLRNPDVQPWYGDEHTRVTVYLRTDKDTHTVFRTIKPNQLQLDGRAVGQDSIDALLRMPVDIFENTILMGQNQPLFFDLKAQAKLDLFSTVLHLDRWDDYAAAASQRVKVLDRKIVLLEGEIAGLEREVEHVQRQYDDARERSREFQEERQKQIKSANARLAEMRPKLEKLRNKIATAELKLDGAGTELNHLSDALPKAEADLRTVQQNYDDFKRKDMEAQAKVELITAELARLHQKKTCPTCGQAIKEHQVATHVAKHKKELKVWEGRVGIPPITKARLVKFTVALKNLRDAEQTFREKEAVAMSALKMMQPDADQLQQEIKVLEQLQHERRDVVDQHAEIAQSLRREKQRLAQEIREAKDDLTLVRRRHARAKFWIKGFGEVRLYIVNDILQELQLVTEGMLGEFGLAGWSVKFAVEQETKSGTTKRGISVMVFSPKNQTFVNWKSWSSGEGQRLRVIGGLALSEVLLNHVGVEAGIEILDEPTAHLSVEGIDDLCEMLAGRARDLNKQIWFTDHKVIEGAVFTSVLTVTKTKDGSTIKQER